MIELTSTDTDIIIAGCLVGLGAYIYMKQKKVKQNEGNNKQQG